MTISETTTRNYEASFTKTMTATEMALTAHNLSPDATYARKADGSLWIWSDRRSAWVQIDFESAPETYEQRYRRTTEWVARHIAQDLMDVNGKTAQVSAADERKIARAQGEAGGNSGEVQPASYRSGVEGHVSR